MSQELTNPNQAVESTPAIESTFDLNAMIEKSAQLDQLKPMITLTADYIELEKPGEHFDGIFIGWQTMDITDQLTGELKKLKAGRFLCNKQVKINAGAVLVKELERADIQAGTALRVTYTKKEGNTKLYSLTLLG
jgi:hypothetical protein